MVMFEATAYTLDEAVRKVANEELDDVGIVEKFLTYLSDDTAREAKMDFIDGKFIYLFSSAGNDYYVHAVGFTFKITGEIPC